MSVLSLAALSLTVLITSFISGILGMAGGMILMGVLLAMLPVPAAMMLHGLTQMASNGWRAWLWRRHIDWRVMGGYVLGALAAISVFFGIAIVVSKPIAYILLGLTPYVSYMLPQRLALNVDRPRQPFLCGAVCTSVQMLAGVAGPLLDVFFVRSQLDRRGVVATKAMSQAFGHLLKVIFFGTISYSAVGRVGDGLSIGLVATCIACAFMGTTLSKSVLERMTDANFRQWTKWTVFSVGTIYLLWGTWQLLRQS
jgi:uncharacterized membrane protein YfcA